MAVISKTESVGSAAADGGGAATTDSDRQQTRTTRIRRGIRGLGDRMVELLFRRSRSSSSDGSAPETHRWPYGQQPGAFVGGGSDGSPIKPLHVQTVTAARQQHFVLLASDGDTTYSVKFEAAEDWPWIDDELLETLSVVQYSWWN